MILDLENMDKEAQKLSLDQKAALIECLIHNLDELDEQECEKLWFEEAQTRYHAYRDGKISGRPADEALKNARAILQGRK